MSSHRRSRKSLHEQDVINGYPLTLHRHDLAPGVSHPDLYVQPAPAQATHLLTVVVRAAGQTIRIPAGIRTQRTFCNGARTDERRDWMAMHRDVIEMAVQSGEWCNRAIVEWKVLWTHRSVSDGLVEMQHWLRFTYQQMLADVASLPILRPQVQRNNT